MRRVLTSSFLFLTIVCLAGCGGGGGPLGNSGGGQTFSLTVLKGQYAFVLAGFDHSGNAMSMAGSFTADGSGHITAGAVDINDNGVAASSTSPLSGVYAFDSAGGNSLGTISLTNTVGTIATQALKFGFALQDSTALAAGGSATGTFGNIMDLSANGFVIAGTMQQQVSPFSLSTLANSSYIITLNGRSSSSPTSVLGRFTLASNGTNLTASNVAFDRSVAGSATGSASATSATVSLTAPDTNGRGTLTVSIVDAFAPNATTQSFFYYTVSANRFIAVENDALGTMTADAAIQSASALSANAVSTNAGGAGAVFGMAGVDTITSNEVSAVGQLQIPGTTVATLGWDFNDNGNPPPTQSFSSQPVAFDPTTGRGVITVGSQGSGVAAGLANTLVFYLSSPLSTSGLSTNGFILDGTLGTTNRAMAGTLTAQASSSFTTASDLTALAIVRARASSPTDATNFLGSFTGLFGAISGTSPTTYEFFADYTAVGAAAPLLDQGIAPLTVAGPNSLTGRGTLTLSNGETFIFYLVGPNQFVSIDASEKSSPIFFASPQ